MDVEVYESRCDHQPARIKNVSVFSRQVIAHGQNLPAFYKQVGRFIHVTGWIN
jgi:hypothetical protein